jgi:hypothetical protein
MRHVRACVPSLPTTSTKICIRSRWENRGIPGCFMQNVDRIGVLVYIDSGIACASITFMSYLY